MRRGAGGRGEPNLRVPGGRGHGSRRDARLPTVSATQRSLTLKMRGPTELVLERADGSQRSIHPLWLRERCRDPAGIDLQTQQRLQHPSDFDLDLKVVAVSQPLPGTYRVKFSDGHEASFSAEEILAEAALTPTSHDCPAPRLWDGTIAAPRTTGRGNCSTIACVRRILRSAFCCRPAIW